jgi:hypothetical protein
MIDTTEELSKVLKGNVIESLELHEDGLHLSMANGQTLILIGVVIIGLLDTRSGPHTLQ